MLNRKLEKTPLKSSSNHKVQNSDCGFYQSITLTHHAQPIPFPPLPHRLFPSSLLSLPLCPLPACQPTPLRCLRPRLLSRIFFLPPVAIAGFLLDLVAVEDGAGLLTLQGYVGGRYGTGWVTGGGVGSASWERDGRGAGEGGWALWRRLGVRWVWLGPCRTCRLGVWQGAASFGAGCCCCCGG